MPYHYLDATLENDPHALPDVRVLPARLMECSACGESAIFEDHGFDDTDGCPECGDALLAETQRGWSFVYEQPGYLPMGEPHDIYATEADALKAAREHADYCAHGFDADTTCPTCDAAREGVE